MFLCICVLFFISVIYSFVNQEILAHRSRRLKGELIGYSWSGVRPASSSGVVNNFKHLLLQNPLPDQSKIYVEPPWVGGTR